MHEYTFEQSERYKFNNELRPIPTNRQACGRVRENLSSLEKSLEHTFSDKSLLSLALTHRSSHKHNNERLEYLGDALLGFVIADALFKKFPDQSEGVLTRLRSNLVKGETLAQLARFLTLGDYISLGSGEMKSGGWHRQSILSNTLEAIIGAIYLDEDFSASRKCILNLYADLLEDIDVADLKKDPKTRLQEYLQARKERLPSYTVIDEQGEAHKREFTVECTVEHLTDPIIALGRSKRSAEQAAAEKALSLIEAKDTV